MRRFLLILALSSVPGWSQPVQQPAQPPIVVKVEMPPAPRRDLLGYFQALGPLIAASVAVGVGWMQYHLQRQKSRQDLFDKRFTVYEAALDYVMVLIGKDGKTGVSDFRQYRTKTDPGQFLFSAEVFAIINDIGRIGLEFRGVQEQLHLYNEVTEDLIVTVDQNPGLSYSMAIANIPRVQQQASQLRGTVNRLLIDLKCVCRPYLQLHDDESWPKRLKARIDRWMESEVPAKFASKARD
jgi:hypothetical protein